MDQQQTVIYEKLIFTPFIKRSDVSKFLSKISKVFKNNTLHVWFYARVLNFLLLFYIWEAV